MKESGSNRRWGRVEVTLSDFQHRMKQPGKPSSTLSRLAVLHQVAKAYAIEDAEQLNADPLTVLVEEITDPPMYDLDFEDGVVVIQYSYEESGRAQAG